MGSLRDVRKVPWLMRAQKQVSAGAREVVVIPLGDSARSASPWPSFVWSSFGAPSAEAAASWRHFLIELLGDRLSPLVVAHPGRAGGRAHPTSKGQERPCPAGLQLRPGGQPGLLPGQSAECPGRPRPPDTVSLGPSG